mmetsp:Transcript_16938/g.47277  ORF Transcript_16938/g.47277 Transcript_16938/m.47277 type:complete len:103 (-) Transcript_16938:51-359(-)
MAATGTLISTLGFIIICYSAWQAVAYRNNLKLSHEPFYGLPVDILGELLVGSALACVGGMGMAGELRPITFLASEQSLRVNTHRLGFMTFNHRGRAFREPSD